MKTAVAIGNGHVPAAAPVAMHMAALAELRTLAEKIIYACEHSDGQTTTGTIRRWLAGHGVPTRDSQRPYISAAVNNWRRDHDLAAQRKRPAGGEVVELVAGTPIEAEEVEPTTLEPAADDRPVTVPDRPQDDIPLPSGRPPDASTAPPATSVRPAGAYGFYAVAALSLTVSVDTSWRFFATELAITNTWERTAMFAVLEAALIACGFGMRAGVRRSGRPGPARFWVWALCGLAAYMAFVLSGPVAGLARVALGPALGLVMLHLALGIEIRAAAHRTGTWARVGRELRERTLSRLGLADDQRDALARTRDRAARRVARLALARSNPRRDRRLARALRGSNAAHDPQARAVMLAELAALRHAGELATLELPSPWKASVSLMSGQYLPTIGGPPMNSEQPPSVPARRRRRIWPWLVLPVIVLATVVVLVSTNSGDDTSSTTSTSDTTSTSKAGTTTSPTTNRVTAQQVIVAFMEVGLPAPHPRDNSKNCASLGCVQMITTDAITVVSFDDEIAAARYGDLADRFRRRLIVLSYGAARTPAGDRPKYEAALESLAS